MLSITDAGALAPCPDPFNLAEHVLAAGRATPDRTAMQVVGAGVTEPVTFGELAAQVGGIAAGLLALGLIPGDRVLLRLTNQPEFPLVFLACAWAGLIPVPTSAALTPPEVASLTAALAPRAVIVTEGVARPEGVEITIADRDLPAMARLAPAPVERGDPDRPGYILFTSGTTGQMRGVIHAHRAIWARRMMITDWYGLAASDRMLHAGAFNWSFTLGTGLLDPWALGATALIPEAGTAPEDLAALLARHQATLFAAAPGIYRKMLKTGDLPALPHLRHGLSAGEKLADPTRLSWEEATGTPIYEAFGMTECSTFLSASPQRPAPPGALGFAQTGRHLAVLDGAGQVVPRGIEGALAIRADDPGLMLGYLDAPALPRRGWFQTGDRVTLGPDGAFTLHGRGDDMMNAGGNRVFPLEVETALCALAGVDEAVAVEISLGPQLSIIAALYGGPQALDEAALAGHMSSCMADYKCPRLYRWCAALPRGANGKIARSAIRAELEAELGQA